MAPFPLTVANSNPPSGVTSGSTTTRFGGRPACHTVSSYRCSVRKVFVCLIIFWYVHDAGQHRICLGTTFDIARRNVHQSLHAAPVRSQKFRRLWADSSRPSVVLSRIRTKTQHDTHNLFSASTCSRRCRPPPRARHKTSRHTLKNPT